jgi:hypothetical protein
MRRGIPRTTSATDRIVRAVAQRAPRKTVSKLYDEALVSALRDKAKRR